MICGAGGGGIGTATSRLLAESGARIVAVDRTAALVDETLAMIETIGGAPAVGIVADLRDPAARDAIVPAALEAVGGLDLLANVAGGMQAEQWGRFEHIPDAVYRDVMALNLDYVFHICRDVVRAMTEAETGGAIVNVASVSALPSGPYHAVYSAAKAAVIALTRSMAAELGQHNIRANVVAPGATKTERAVQLSGDRIDQRQRDWAPLGRSVASEDVAEAIRFLLSPAAASITGQVVAVDCGLTARSVLGGADYFEDRLSF